MRRVAFVLVVLLSVAPAGSGRAGHEWYDHYEAAQQALDRSAHAEALEALDRARQLRPEAGRLRTYGNTFIVYLPEAVQALALFGLGRDEEALEWTRRAQATGLLAREPALAARLRSAAAAARLRAQRQESPRTQERQSARGTEPSTLGGEPPVSPSTAPHASVGAQGPPETATPSPTAASPRETATPSSAIGPSEASPRGPPAGSRSTPVPADRTPSDREPVTESASTPGDPQAPPTSDAAIGRGSAAPGSANRDRPAGPAKPGRDPEGSAEGAAKASRLTEATVLLREGLRDYFAGEHAGAERRLTVAAQALPESAGVRAVLGALRYTRYLLDGRSDQGLVEQAALDFQGALELDPDLVLDERLFSPEVRDFLERRRHRKAPADPP